MRTRDKLILVAVVILTVIAATALIWSDFGNDGMSYGLDLEGGAHLVYEAQLDQLPEGEDRDAAMQSIIAVIENRINAYGVSEPEIRRVGDDRIMVQMPGVKDIEEAKELIGKTALINFREFKFIEPESNGTPAQTGNTGSPSAPAESGGPMGAEDGGSTEPAAAETPLYFALSAEGELERVDDKSEAQYQAVRATGEIDGKERALTSQYFSGSVDFRMYASTNQPVVAFTWDNVGSDLFEQITGRLTQYPEGSVERRLGIFLGDEMISAPNVKSVIRDEGVIEGMSRNEAKRLTSLLNAGRIDVPLERIEEHNVSASLGAQFIEWSKKAGLIGLALVIMFMVLRYRVPGTAAGLALMIYTVLVLGTYQAIPITLTLAGIAGFILSIGMAVDANVLIFERMNEELRRGRTVRAAVEVGFNRAWPAIRDSNISTFITCGILYWMGNELGVPSVQGFALTLLIGVAISMFSAIVITRSLLRVIGSSMGMKNQALLISGTRQMKLTVEGK